MIPYEDLGVFILRTPTWSIEDPIDIIIKSETFSEAIYLASPNLYKYHNIATISDPNVTKSLIKYCIRATHRCTPFGLFAGCSTGQISDEVEIIVMPVDRSKRITRFDMLFLSALSDAIYKMDDILLKIPYKLNSSIHCTPREYRYIEVVQKNNFRTHNIASIEKTDYIEKIINQASKGGLFEDLVNAIIDDEISKSDAEEFVNQIIECQLIKSSIDIYTTGKDAFEELRHKLMQTGNTSGFLKTINELSKALKEIDSHPIGSTIHHYEQIIKHINQLNIPFDKKYLFQTDLYKPHVKSKLSKLLVSEVKDLMSFLNTINPIQLSNNQDLEYFKKDFIARYEDREVSLQDVIDPEIGIGYGYSQNVMSPLLEGLLVPPTKNNDKANDIETYLITKELHDSWTMRDEINLESYISQETILHWDDLPLSMSAFLSIYKNGDDHLVYVKGIFGVSATNLIGRFSHIDDEILNILKIISKREQEQCTDAIFAAICHLPDSRVGNIIFRSSEIRDYEIPYLSNSSIPNEKQIPISDLSVSIKNNRIILKSIKNGKEVIPRLDNAHNYQANPTPIYKFLCDLQHVNGRSHLHRLPWNNLINTFEYIPRIMYKKFILQLASWVIKYDDIKKGKLELIEDFNEYRKKRKIPRYVVIAEGDNELRLDCLDDIQFSILIDHIKKVKIAILNESLQDQFDCVVFDTNGKPYVNEIIIPLVKTVQKR